MRSREAWIMARSSTEEDAATIELTPEDEMEIERIRSRINIGDIVLPEGIHLVTSTDEAAANKARNTVDGDAAENTD